MLMIGTLIGGILVGRISEKIHVNNSGKFFLITTLALLPIGGTLVFNINSILSYAIIVCSTVLIMASVTMFNITIITFIQKETPLQIMGKIIAFISTISICTLPLGQLIYGYLFDVMMDKAYIIILGVIFINMFITIASKRMFKLLC